MQPTSEQISEWKKEYRDIFSVDVRGVTYVFRSLTFSEFETVLDVQKSDSNTDAEDFAVITALIFPVGLDMNSLQAGVVSVLSDQIIEMSGFGGLSIAKDILEDCRAQSSTVHYMMKAFVIASIPSYKPEELDDLTFRELATKVALAERVMDVNQSAFGMEDSEVRLSFIDPDEEAAKESEEAKKQTSQRKAGQAVYGDPIADKLRQAMG